MWLREYLGEIADLIQQSEQRTVARVDQLDQRINGRVSRIEEEIGAMKLVEARRQGAAEALEAAGMGASALPPPVTTSQTVASKEPSKWTSFWDDFDKRLVALISAAAVLLGAIAAMKGAGPPP